jgi:hypothetical protein
VAGKWFCSKGCKDLCKEIEGEVDEYAERPLPGRPSYGWRILNGELEEEDDPQPQAPETSKLLRQALAILDAQFAFVAGDLKRLMVYSLQDRDWDFRTMLCAVALHEVRRPPIIWFSSQLRFTTF